MHKRKRNDRRGNNRWRMIERGEREGTRNVERWMQSVDEAEVSEADDLRIARHHARGARSEVGVQREVHRGDDRCVSMRQVTRLADLDL